MLNFSLQLLFLLHYLTTFNCVVAYHLPIQPLDVCNLEEFGYQTFCLVIYSH